MDGVDGDEEDAVETVKSLPVPMKERREFRYCLNNMKGYRIEDSALKISGITICFGVSFLVKFVEYCMFSWSEL